MAEYYNQGPSYSDTFRASLRTRPTPYEQTPPKSNKKIFILAGGGLAIAAVIAIASIAIPKVSEAKADADFMENSSNDLDAEEVLNDDFKAAVAKNEHASYSFTESVTPYAELTPKSVCEALNIDCEALKNPANYSKLVKTDAMNSNALDYFLDSGNIVVMVAKYKQDKTNTMVIYGRYDFFYQAFELGKQNDRQYSKTGSTTRSGLFNDVVGVPDFYIVKGVTNGA